MRAQINRETLPLPTFPDALDVACDAAAWLNCFRACVRLTRTARKLDPTEICLRSSNCPDGFAVPAMLGLAIALHSAFPSSPVFFRPGAPSRSFDENWILSCLAATARQDQVSLEFLIRSRVRQTYRGHIKQLIKAALHRAY